METPRARQINVFAKKVLLEPSSSLLVPVVPPFLEEATSPAALSHGFFPDVSPSMSLSPFYSRRDEVFSPATPWKRLSEPQEYTKKAFKPARHFSDIKKTPSLAEKGEHGDESCRTTFTEGEDSCIVDDLKSKDNSQSDFTGESHCSTLRNDASRKFFKTRRAPSIQSLLTSYVKTTVSADAAALLHKSCSNRGSIPLAPVEECLDLTSQVYPGPKAATRTINKENVFSKTGEPAVNARKSLDRSDSRRITADSLPASKRSPRLLHSYCSSDQSRLDLGQKQVAGGPLQCPLCGMMYASGDATDEACHQRFHSKAMDALKFPGWKSENVVVENLDGSRVICIMPCDRGHMLNKLKAIQSVMDEELGAHDSTSLLQHGRKAYLYISAKSPQQRVMGVCIAEPVTQGYRLLDNETASDEAVHACCGIYRLWVSCSGRRQGVASNLVNAVRMHCVPGRYIAKEELAFSDPTDQGKLFAASYTGSREFLIYK